MIYEFKVTLLDVGTPVWRKIQVDASTNFYDLHRILQVVFDWDNYHLHTFYVDKTNGQRVNNVQIKPTFDEEFDFFDHLETYQEDTEIISDWFEAAKDKTIYTYDFGDDWRHEIVFMKKIKPEQGVMYPRCVDAENSAPEEDSRFEVMSGQAPLEHVDRKELIKEINESMHDRLSFLVSEIKEKGNDYWSELLLKSKAYHKLKPWQRINDEMVFAVEDPVTKEMLFCSVLGAAGETFGLAVYIGQDGYNALIDTLTREEPDFTLVSKQRAVVLFFNDREELEHDEYTLIKTYDVPFRGRKSWPSFRSYKPGEYPWLIDDEEARLMLLALDAVIDFYGELDDIKEVPYIFHDEKVITKIPKKVKDDIVFQNEMITIDDDFFEVDEPDLAVSEMDLKRMQKQMKTIPASVEFLMEYLNMPIQLEPTERPFFPVISLAVNHNEGGVVYQNVLEEKPGSDVMQRELLQLFEAMGGIPRKLLVNEKTADKLEPVIKQLNLNVQSSDFMSIAPMIIEEMHKEMFN